MDKVKSIIKDFNINENKFIIMMISILIVVFLWITYMNAIHFPDVMPIGRGIGVLIFILTSSRFKIIDRTSIIIKSYSITNYFTFYVVLSVFITGAYILGAVLENTVLSIFLFNHFATVIKTVHIVPSISEISTVYLYCLVAMVFFSFIINAIEIAGRYFSIAVLLLIIGNLNGHRIMSFISSFLACSQPNLLAYIWWTIRMLLVTIIFFVLNQLLLKSKKETHSI